MESLRFLFKIDPIAPYYDCQPENRWEDRNWIPPTVPGAIATTHTQWYQWGAGGVTPAENIGSASHDTPSSLFYNSESSQFLGVPFDCRVQSVQESIKINGNGWRRLMFRHKFYPKNAPRPLSILGFDEEHHVLASRVKPSWMPELLPESFRQNQPEIGNNAVENQSTGLTGKLSLIIALIALSCPPDRVLETIKTSFKPPYWYTHSVGGDSKWAPTSNIR